MMSIMQNNIEKKTIVRWQLNDTIAILLGPDRWGTHRRQVVFPHVARCRICGGVEGFFRLSPEGKLSYDEKDKVYDAALGLRIADQQHGVMYLQFNDNSPPFICSNDCQANKEKYSTLDLKLQALIIDDTTWKLTPDSNPRRGWHSYEREFLFSRELTKAELNDLGMHLKYDKKSPHGQGLPMVALKGGTTYRATCYLDSGD